MTKKFRKIFGLFLLLATAPFISNIENVTGDNQVRWILVGVATSLGCLSVVAVAWWHSMAKRSGQPLSLKGMIVVANSIGVAFGLNVAFWSAVLQLETVQPRVNQVVIDSIVVSGGAYLLIAFLRRLEMDQRRRAVLLEDAVNVYLAQSDGKEITSRLQETLSNSLEDALAPARENLARQLEQHGSSITKEKWLGIAEYLRETVDKTVRTYSSELWRKATSEKRSLTLKRIIYDVVKQQPFRVGWIVLVYLITALSEVIANLGWWIGSLNLLSGVTLIVLILGGANWMMRRQPKHHTIVFVSSILFLQSFGPAMFFWRERWSENPYQLGEVISSIFLGILIILLSSGMGSFRELESLEEKNFVSRLDHERIKVAAANRQLAHLARESARVLHGRVQTRLIACAIAIERAAETDDTRAFRAAMDEALSILTTRPLVESAIAGNLIDEVSKKVALWSGLCEIKVDIPSALSQYANQNTIRNVGRVVEEGLSNAVRHGEASVIAIRIREISGTLQIEVTDNGLGPKGGTAGLGSALLDSVSKDWTLEPLKAGSRLTVIVEVQ